MPQVFVYRTQAADYAKRQNWSSFRTQQDEHGMWFAHYEPGESPAQEFGDAHPDFVAWVETDWYRPPHGSPSKIGVLVVSCRREELTAADVDAIDRNAFAVEPQTPSLWDGDSAAKGKAQGRKANADAPKGERAKSDAPSPVKTVWETADAMPGASRADVVAACVAKGVNKATAGTQFYRWQKARGM